MARPIKETPILFGDDAQRFEERMKNPPKETEEERQRRIKNYREVLSWFDNDKKDEDANQPV